MNDCSNKRSKARQHLSNQTGWHNQRYFCTDSYGGNMIYISTDYVFDGKTAPYKVTDQTNPVNIYGKLKLDGELATLGVDPGRS